MTCDLTHPRACLGCGADLSWRAGIDVSIAGVPTAMYLAPMSFTIATIDGVPISGGVDPADPRAALVSAAEPFCRDCFDARMARAVPFEEVPCPGN